MIEELKGYLYNPRRVAKPEDLAQRPAPDPVKKLAHRKRITREYARFNYISKALGQLQKEGFVFAYSALGGWLDWPDDYLEAVLTHYYAELALHDLWAYEAQAGQKASAKLSETENKKLSAAADAITKALAARYNNRNRPGAPVII